MEDVLKYRELWDRRSGKCMNIRDKKKNGWKWNDWVVSYKLEGPPSYYLLSIQHPVYLDQPLFRSATSTLVASVLPFLGLYHLEGIYWDKSTRPSSILTQLLAGH